METAFPLLFAAFVGFVHAFEADHLLAVSNIVTKRNSILLAIKELDDDRGFALAVLRRKDSAAGPGTQA